MEDVAGAVAAVVMVVVLAAAFCCPFRLFLSAGWVELADDVAALPDLWREPSFAPLPVQPILLVHLASAHLGFAVAASSKVVEKEGPEQDVVIVVVDFVAVVVAVLLPGFDVPAEAESAGLFATWLPVAVATTPLLAHKLHPSVSSLPC